MNLKFKVENAQRLDLFLSEKLELSRSQVQKIIKSNSVVINERLGDRPGEVLKVGDDVRVAFKKEEQNEIIEYKIDLSILYEDDYLLVIDKPIDLTMHPGAGNKEKTLFNAVYSYLGGIKPEIVHRLDKDTSGIVVVAKNLEIKNELSIQFSERTVERFYHALVLTTPRSKRKIQLEPEGIIETHIGRNPKDRLKMSVLENSGRIAVTSWKVEEFYTYGALVRLKLGTGRTHQIRVHMEYLGSPVLGDKTYGDFSALPHNLRLKVNAFPRQALHASLLEFTHPVTKKRLSFSSNPPIDFVNLQKILKEFQ